MADEPTTINETLAHFDLFTDEKLVASMIGFREAQGCKIVMLYVQMEADVKYVTGFNNTTGPEGTSISLPIKKTWVLVSTAP